MTDLADATAADLHHGFLHGQFTPLDVLDAVLARIGAVEERVQALYAFDPDAARQAAEASAGRWGRGEPLGPIDGVPITLKENIPTRGVPVPVGTAATELAPAAADAPIARRVRGAGAVILAKTTMPDYGMASSGLSSFHPLTRNPWGLDWNPGGSSAGAAAAAAAGYGPLHVGTDIGGSIRLPAGWTATTGLKPTFGLVPVDPPYYGRAAGPMTRTADDAARLMSVLAGPDDGDHFSLPGYDAGWTAGPDPSFAEGLCVGLLSDAGAGLPVEPEVHHAVEAAARVFADAGARVVPLEPFFDAQMLHDLDLFWRARGWKDFSDLSPERQDRVLPYIADWCRGGADVNSATLLRCVNRMIQVGSDTLQATSGYDLVLAPVAPIPTYPAEHPSPTNDVSRAMEHIAFTVPYNFSHQPAVSVNCGFTDDGRPLGLQIIGRRFDDANVLRAAGWYERTRPALATPHWPPPAVPNAAHT